MSGVTVEQGAAPMLNRLAREQFKRRLLADLTVDADGVPIHLGDLLFRGNGDMHYCHGIGKPSLDIMDEHLKWWRSECFHHTKPRTVEDVLMSAGVSVAIIEDVADELRELMGVDE